MRFPVMMIPDRMTIPDTPIQLEVRLLSLILLDVRPPRAMLPLKLLLAMVWPFPERVSAFPLPEKVVQVRVVFSPPMLALILMLLLVRLFPVPLN